jgi:hypothetical protein
LLLGGFVFSRPRQWPAKRDWWPLLVCGLLWFGVYNVALNEAEKRLDAGIAAMLAWLLLDGSPATLAFAGGA